MSEIVKVLMIDDDEEDFLIMRDIIADIQVNKYNVEWLSSFDTGLKGIAEKKHDIYLVDYRLGAHNGLELIEKAIAAGCEEPMILLTGQNDIEVDRQAMKIGAADYIVKGAVSAQQLERYFRYSIDQFKNLKEIKNLNAYLENRVRDRTLVLEEALSQLEKSQEELNRSLEREKEINELKSRFVSMASHEFRTPLTTIMSSLSLLSKYIDSGEPDKQKRHIERIKTSIINLTDLLNDILSVSKLEEGKVSVAHERIHVKETIAGVIEDLHGITKEGQEIRYTHKGQDEMVMDKKILKHVLQNMLSNAIKFSPVHAVIKVTSEIEDGIFTLQVSDKGIGISEEDQKHLFERFFRGKNVTNIQGSGLGLNIVAQSVRLLGGTVNVKSALNEGTTFIVKIPVA